VQYPHHMKTFASLLLATAMFAGCQSDSKLDQKSGGDLEARVKKLEETNAKYAEALDFLQQAYEQQKQQQKQQQAQQEREEPAPDATFAVDIAPDIAGGQVEGPATACVTLVEAWDFA
jgi:outer membrane murein-binding lipoprotein Lpp